MNRILIAISSLFVAACSYPSNVDNDHETKMYEVHPGNNVKFKSSGKQIKVTVASVLESRCPSNANCVWEGKVDVNFQFGDQKNLIMLCLPEKSPNCEQETEVNYQSKKFTLKLLNVEPYPTTNNGSEPKIVTFEVTRK